MDKLPLCFYSIQGDMQCDILENKDPAKGRPYPWGAFDAQGNVTGIASFDTLHQGFPGRATSANQYAHVDTVSEYSVGNNTYIGFFQNAPKNLK